MTSYQHNLGQKLGAPPALPDHGRGTRNIRSIVVRPVRTAAPPRRRREMYESKVSPRDMLL